MSRSQSASPRNVNEAKKSRKAFSKMFDFEDVDLEGLKIKKEFLATPTDFKANLGAIVEMLKKLRTYEHYFDKEVAKQPGANSITVSIPVNGVLTNKTIDRSIINRMYSDLYDMIRSTSSVFKTTAIALTHRKKKSGRLPPITYFVDEMYDGLYQLISENKYADMGEAPIVENGVIDKITIRDQVLNLLQSKAPVSPKVISSILMKMIDIDQKTRGIAPSKYYSLPQDIIDKFESYVTTAENTSQTKQALKRAKEMDEYVKIMGSGRAGTPGVRSAADVPTDKEPFNRNKFKYVNLSSFVTTFQDKNKKVVDDVTAKLDEYKTAKSTYQMYYKSLLEENKKFNENVLVDTFKATIPNVTLDVAKREAKKYALGGEDLATKEYLKMTLYASKLDQYKSSNAAINALSAINTYKTSNPAIYNAIEQHANSTYYQNILTNSNNLRKFEEELINPKKSVSKPKKSKK